MNHITLTSLVCIFLFAVLDISHAHHVLGRPSYSISHGSATPPSMNIETRLGKYFVTLMAFPAFPKANEYGRVNVYIRRIQDGVPFNGEVKFTLKDDSWFSSTQELIGTQTPRDSVFKQGYVINKEGDYLIGVNFYADNEPYTVELPLRIGSPWPIGPLGIFVSAVFVLLIGVNLLIRRRLGRMRVKRHRAEA